MNDLNDVARAYAKVKLAEAMADEARRRWLDLIKPTPPITTPPSEY